MDISKNTAAVFNWYKELPPWAKGVMIIGISATTIYTVHTIVKSIKAKKAKEKSQADVIGFVNDLKSLSNQGINPTFQQSQYQTFAAAIQQQFTGCDVDLAQCPDWLFSLKYSNSGQVVANIISNFKNDADFLALQAAWGIRTYDACGIFNGDITDVTLSAAINDELDVCEIAGLNKILASKNITYKF